MASLIGKAAAKRAGKAAQYRVQEPGLQPLPALRHSKHGHQTYASFSDLDAQDVIAAVRRGVPARMLDSLVHDMNVSRAVLLSWIDIPEATIKRKIRDDALLGKAAGEQALGMARLIGLVERMVNESGDAQGFDAATWLARWLAEPNPVFNGACPGQFLDTAEGRMLVGTTLQQMQSGAYA